MRLLRASVIACCISASVVMGFDLTCVVLLTLCVTVGLGVRITSGVVFLAAVRFIPLLELTRRLINLCEVWLFLDAFALCVGS